MRIFALNIQSATRRMDLEQPVKAVTTMFLTLALMSLADFASASEFQFLDTEQSGRWYAKLMAGLIHGYKEPYEDKIPFNGLGIAPAVMPALGARHDRVDIEGGFHMALCQSPIAGSQA